MQGRGAAVRRAYGAVVAAMLGIACLPAHAQMDGFQSPTGNIMCLYWPGDGIRCDMERITNQPPPVPADCDGSWGRAFALPEDRGAVRLCVTDSAFGHYSVLNYGETFKRGQITCHSARSGVMCRNARGAGFELSRARQRLF